MIDSNGQMKVIDLGLAKRRGDSDLALELDSGVDDLSFRSGPRRDSRTESLSESQPAE
jgi:hypothetical protein